MTTLNLKKVPKLKKSPLLRGLPDKLKDISSYKEIEQKLRLMMVSDHTHSTVKAFAQCARCKAKVERRRKTISDFGFKSFEQYMAWRQVMDVIYNQKQIKV